VGEFDFALIAGPPGDAAVSDVAISLDVSGVITDAESLATWVESQAIPTPVPFGTVKQLLKWDAVTQSFMAWSHEFGYGDNFPVQLGDYVYVSLDEHAPSAASFVGRVPLMGELHFSLTPGTATDCGMNFLSLPLDHPEITNADELSDAIGTSNPPGPATVIQALDWLAPLQSLAAWSNEFGFGDNFATTIGYPYTVCLSTNNVPPIWP